jgi:hypothetical protein
VDRNPERALKMAQIENDLGIRSTYYFRMKEDVFQPNIINEIANMYHEIGYHYEVLDKANGNFSGAIKLFEDELKEFRKIYDVKTICMHGNPLSPWDNRDLWEKYDFKDFKIIGEPYLSSDYNTLFYLTDTGRSWSSKFSVKDVVNTNLNHTIKRKNSTGDVIRIIKKMDIEQICIVAHPERWSNDLRTWLAALLWQNVKNIGKLGIIKYRRIFHD